MFKLLPVIIVLSFFIAACMPEPGNSPQVDKSPVYNEPDRLSEVSNAPLSSPQSDLVIGKMESKAVTGQPEMELATKRVMPSPLYSFATNPQINTTTNRDRFAELVENGVKLVSEAPLSTFSIDVDTGSYSLIRKYLAQGQLPPANAVRSEELINYFSYHFAKPRPQDHPFAVSTEIARTPWNKNTHLLQIGIQGYQPDHASRPASNLVFLIDVSGSMEAADKLPLLKNALGLLVKQLRGEDRITLVVYAGASGVVLQPTSGDQQADILAALDRLSAGGSTHGSAGIKLAYAMARQGFIKDGVNRVILATDGDFNVGTVNHEALLNLVERNKRDGIALTTLGFGSGNYNDQLMEQLADHGDGNYAYIDNLNEARKVLVEQMDATLETIARDVKIQVEWNPDVVYEYRLIGYENRILQREDFNNDKVDAGDIGAGHTVTALYEITFNDSAVRRIPALRYQTQTLSKADDAEIAMINIRYKKPAQENSQLINQAITRDRIQPEFSSASNDLRFASAVAAYAELLRGGDHLHQFGYPEILELARSSRGSDEGGYRSAFLSMVALSQSLDS